MTPDQKQQLIQIIQDHNWTSVEDAVKALRKRQLGEEQIRERIIPKDAYRVELESELRSLIENAGLATWPIPENVTRKQIFDAIGNAVDNAPNKITAVRLGNRAMYLIFELSQKGVTESELKEAHFGQPQYTVSETYRERLPSLWQSVCGDESELTDATVRELMGEAQQDV